MDTKKSKKIISFNKLRIFAALCQFTSYLIRDHSTSSTYMEKGNLSQRQVEGGVSKAHDHEVPFFGDIELCERSLTFTCHFPQQL